MPAPATPASTRNAQNAKAQTYANHARMDPAFHFILVPFFLVNIIVAAVFAWHLFPVHPFLAIWLVLLAIALLGAITLTRTYSLKVQDRVIRLEEQLRLLTLFSATSQQPPALTTRQLIALRFASDTEAPTLAHRAARENLTPKQIKEAIAQWRADTHRV